MARIRRYLAGLVPRRIHPIGRRITRRYDQMLGHANSRNRRGVVLMLHIGRCGSTVLANMLHQNPEVYWDGKIHRIAQQLYGKRVADLDYARWTKEQFVISGSRYYGFEYKFLEDQYSAVLGTTTERFLAACEKIGVTHYIVLKRRNTLRHLISHYASKNRGNWHISPDGESRAQQFAIDCGCVTTGSAPGRTLMAYLQEVDHAYAKISTLLAEQNVLQIDYEEDIESCNANAAYQKVCEFLDITCCEVAVKNRKTNPFSPAQSLTNYSEVVGCLNGTAYEWMLEVHIE
ncbi:hypothetical protein NG895_15725 [Aeoliella sp. ICT_H6.2]|uniref:Uncharacterized protein n=1 Tax=Aeoliella straminimaris TaxID=2954799 RepID=A0A9X2FHX8_9BACT|nr:hypothetical protein [Aeoliella straminimaris]MCO6045361.1 hypothetical protein [Aeoliella straminimaris]